MKPVLAQKNVLVTEEVEEGLAREEEAGEGLAREEEAEEAEEVAVDIN
jgi:hypothetical protein